MVSLAATTACGGATERGSANDGVSSVPSGGTVAAATSSLGGATEAPGGSTAQSATETTGGTQSPPAWGSAGSVSGGTSNSLSSTTASVPKTDCGDGACCVPVTLNLAKSRAYAVDGTLYVELGVNADAALLGPDQSGDVQVEMTTTDGAAMQCQFNTHIRAIDKLVFVQCQGVAPVTPQCDSSVEFNVRLTSSIKWPTIVCESQGFAGSPIQTAVPLACPKCDYSAAHTDPCDYPSALRCSYSLQTNTEVRTTDCWCLSGSAATRHWNCVIR